MSSVENCQRILEAIDQLRRRKARPDRKRICNYVCRRHCISPAEVVDDLERLVDEQTVIKVEYKGNISYRNAAKWAKLSVHKSRVEVERNQMNKVDRLKTETERMTYALRGAVSALIVKERECLLNGVPAVDLEQYLQAKDADFFGRVSFTSLMDREVATGNIVKLVNGNYSFRPIAATMRLALSPMASPLASPMASPAGSDDANTTKEDAEAFADSRMSTSPSQSWPDDESKAGLDGDPDAELEVNSPSAPCSPAPNPGASPNQDRPDPVHNVDDHENDPEPAATDQSVADSLNAETAEGVGYRAGERRKRAKKKVFDPSDNNIPTGRKRGRPAGSFKQGSAKHDENGNKEKPEAPPVILGPLCALCNAEIKDTKSTPCRDCTKKAHTSCVQKSLKNATKAQPGPWQCSLCKTCQTCSQTKEMGNMAVCYSCDEAYHVKCLSHRPKLPLKKWMCPRCNPPPEPKSVISTPDNSPLRGRGPPVLVPMLPTTLSPVATDVYADLNDSGIDESIPDASDWTAEQVFQHFVKIFPDHAKVFQEQDVDGRSLLLMTRHDVVNGLGLKLGPALKIYGQVKRMQLRRSERHLLWE